MPGPLLPVGALATEALCESVAAPGPSSSAWKRQEVSSQWHVCCGAALDPRMPALALGSGPSASQTEGGTGGRVLRRRPSGHRVLLGACCLASGDALQAPVADGGAGAGGCPLRPSQASRTVCGQPHRTSQSAGIVQSWWLPGPAKRCALLRVRCQGPRTPPCTNSPLCVCLGWYRGYTLRKKSKKVSGSSH